MRIVFMGTPTFAVPALRALVDAGHDMVAAYTQPPRPGGRRGREPVASEVQRQAEYLGIPVRSPASLKTAEAQADFAALAADVAVVAAYGLILPPAILVAPRLGCINIHASLLPRWRGAAPVHRAILAGDAATGVTIMQMEAGLDTGPMLLCGSAAIGFDETERVTERLANLGAELICAVLADPDAYPPVAQVDGDATYAAKILKHEGRIDFTGSAIGIARQVQAFSPRPGAYCDLIGERIKLRGARPLATRGNARHPPGLLLDLLDAPVDCDLPDRRNVGFVIACGDGYLLPSFVQRPGKAWLTTADFLKGNPGAIGGIAT